MRPKRRRLLTTPLRKKSLAPPPTNPNTFQLSGLDSNSTSSPRGRLQGALLDALLDPKVCNDSDSENVMNVRRENIQEEDSTSEEERKRRRTPVRYLNPSKSYVLKLFDRSVDLSQFEDDSPLYPICRAWMLNQPKLDYKSLGQTDDNTEDPDAISLPGPEGPPVSRIPKLLDVQAARNKDNINLNYQEAPPPTRESLLQGHMYRWAEVRKAWVDQAARVEARYEATQDVLNKININAI